MKYETTPNDKISFVSKSVLHSFMNIINEPFSMLILEFCVRTDSFE